MSKCDPPTFRSLEVGQRFKFFAGGSLLTKTGHRTYCAPQWNQPGLAAYDLDQSVIPEAPASCDTEGTDSNSNGTAACQERKLLHYEITNYTGVVLRTQSTPDHSEGERVRAVYA